MDSRPLILPSVNPHSFRLLCLFSIFIPAHANIHPSVHSFIGISRLSTVCQVLCQALQGRLRLFTIKGADGPKTSAAEIVITSVYCSLTKGSGDQEASEGNGHISLEAGLLSGGHYHSFPGPPPL